MLEAHEADEKVGEEELEEVQEVEEVKEEVEEVELAEVVQEVEVEVCAHEEERKCRDLLNLLSAC